MAIELARPRMEDADALGEICHQAFHDIFARHGLTSDFPNAQAGRGLVRMIISRPDFYGVAARVDGKLVGSNFVQLSDTVAGVGPITVAPNSQANGIGRALMQDVVDHAIRNHGTRVRLVQDAVNTTSLSLYTSLGFSVVEPLAMVSVAPAGRTDPSARPAVIGDLDRMDELCQRIYHVSRRNELAGMIGHGAVMGMYPYVRELGNQLKAYAVASFLGHGVGESVDDLLAVLQASRAAQPSGMEGSMAAVLCPSRDGDMYRALLKAGGRTIRCLHLMAMGPYDQPTGHWYSSIGY